MADLDKEPVDKPPLEEEELSLREKYAEEANVSKAEAAEGEESEIQIGHQSRPPSVSEGTTEGQPSPAASVPSQQSDILSMLQQMTQAMSLLAAEVVALKAQAHPAAAVVPAPAAPTVNNPSIADPEDDIVNRFYIPTELKLPKWGGKHSANIANWVCTVRAMLPTIKGSEMNKISSLIKALEGQAHDVAINFFTRANNMNQPVTWEGIVQELLETFGSPDLEREARAELLTLKQKPGEDVTTYLLRFEALALRLNDLSDADKVSRIEHGLREPFRSHIAKLVANQKAVDENFSLTEKSLRATLKRYSLIESNSGDSVSLNAIGDAAAGNRGSVAPTNPSCVPRVEDTAGGPRQAADLTRTSSTVDSSSKGSRNVDSTCNTSRNLGSSGSTRINQESNNSDIRQGGGGSEDSVDLKARFKPSDPQLSSSLKTNSSQQQKKVVRFGDVDVDEGPQRNQNDQETGSPSGEKIQGQHESTDTSLGKQLPKGAVTFMPGVMGYGNQLTIDNWASSPLDNETGANPSEEQGQCTAAVVAGNRSNNLGQLTSDTPRIDHPEVLTTEGKVERQEPGVRKKPCWEPRTKKDWAAVERAISDQSETLQAFCLELKNMEHQKSTGGRMLILNARLGGHKKVFKALMDSGANGNFMSMAALKELQLPVRPLKDSEARTVFLANGQPCRLDCALAPTVNLTLSSSTGEWKGPCTGEATLHVLPQLDSYDIILGTPFCSQFEATLNFRGQNPTVQLLCPTPGANKRVTLTANTSPKRAVMQCSYVRWQEMIQRDEVEEFFLCLLSPNELVPEATNLDPSSSSAAVDGATKVELWDNLDDELENKDTSELPPVVEDEFEPLRQKIREKYADILDPELKGPPADRSPDLTHKIPFTKEGQENPPKAARPRPMNPRYNDELKRVVTQLLEKGLIRPSSSPLGSAVLFAQKKDGSLRFCVDYRAINKATKKDNYPIPNIGELLDRLHGAKYFTSIDLASGYWQIRVDDCDIEKTAFVTRYGSYEFVVMPFGLTGAPDTFQRVMNKIFGPETDDFLLLYLDDILIFSKTLEEHEEHVNIVMNKLREHFLKANPKKCKFVQIETEFLGHIVSGEGIRVDPAKVAAVTALAPPRNIGDLRSFLGSANFYRRFIENFAHIAAPLTDLTKGGIAFLWHEDAEAAFIKLKEALTTAPVLRPPDMSKPFHVYTDASEVAIGAALMQWIGLGKDAANNQAPVAYASRVLSPVERRWATHERELLGVIYALKQFKHYLLGSKFTATVRTDHQSLRYFQTQKDISPKQARWLEFLQEFNIGIEYVEGKANLVADMLSRLRREPVLIPTSPTEKEGTAKAPLQLHVISTVSFDLDHQGLEKLKDTLQTDEFAQELIQKIERGEDAKWHGATFVMDDNLLYRQARRGRQLYVPLTEQQRKLLVEYHDAPIAGHLGRDKTLEAISRKFWWPSIHEDVEDYVKSCQSCQNNKPRKGLPAGKLMPLPTPEYPWQQVTLDLMGPFHPTQEGLDMIVVFVDRFSKMVHARPCRQTDGAMQIAEIFHEHVFRLHGLPSTIVSDRDPRWTGKFWSRLFEKLGSRLDMSTAFHPQTDGQTENANKNIQQILRSLVQGRPEDWKDCLSATEFAINNAVQASTGLSPFEICNGRKAAVPAAFLVPTEAAGLVPAVDEWIKRQQEVIELVTKNLEKAQGRQKQYADRKRSNLQFSEGQLVKLVSSALKKKQHGAVALGKKLSPRFHGPFKVEKMVGPNAAVLELPGNVSDRKHRTFNVDKLAPWFESEKFPWEADATTTAAVKKLGAQITDETRYIVEDFRVVKKQSRAKGRSRWEVLVKWKDYSEEDNTWEPVSVLKKDLKNNFWEFYRKMVQSTGEDPLEVMQDDEEDG